MEYTKDEKTALWLDGLHIDYARRAKLLAPVPAPYALVRRFSAYAAAVRGVVGEETFARMERSLSSPAFMRGLLTRYAEKGITAVTYYSEGYPAQLKELPDPPLVLYCRGDLSLLQARMFCIVGSRHTPPAVRKLTEKWAGGTLRSFRATRPAGTRRRCAARSPRAESASACSRTGWISSAPKRAAT